MGKIMRNVARSGIALGLAFAVGCSPETKNKDVPEETTFVDNVPPKNTVAEQEPRAEALRDTEIEQLSPSFKGFSERLATLTGNPEAQLIIAGYEGCRIKSLAVQENTAGIISRMGELVAANYEKIQSEHNLPTHQPTLRDEMKVICPENTFSGPAG